MGCFSVFLFKPDYRFFWTDALFYIDRESKKVKFTSMFLDQSVHLLSAIEMLLKFELMLTNIKKFEIIETKYEYFNTLSKHFVESKKRKSIFISICVDLAF